MNKIIVVGDYSREDFCLVGKILKDNFEIIFLEYLSETEVKNSAYKKWGKAIFWKDYKSAVEMIDEIRPAFVLFYFGFTAISQLPVFQNGADYYIEMIGIEYHYQSISRGVLDTRDIVYFLSLIFFFLLITRQNLQSR